jgi:hypothetical protein
VWVGVELKALEIPGQEALNVLGGKLGIRDLPRDLAEDFVQFLVQFQRDARRSDVFLGMEIIKHGWGGLPVFGTGDVAEGGRSERAAADQHFDLAGSRSLNRTGIVESDPLYFHTPDLSRFRLL